MIHCSLLLPLFLGFCVSFMVSCAVFGVLTWVMRVLAALLQLNFWCYVAVIVPYLFLNAMWVGMQFVIVAFPCKTHLLFSISFYQAI